MEELERELSSPPVQRSLLGELWLTLTLTLSLSLSLSLSLTLTLTLALTLTLTVALTLGELWRFLMHKHAHRAHAARRTPGAVGCVVASMEAHPRDAAVLRGGFGCLSLLGADKASGARPQIASLAPRIRTLLSGVDAVRAEIATSLEIASSLGASPGFRRPPSPTP